VFGNIVPATAGARVIEYFRIGAPADADLIGVPEGTFVAIEREGPLNAVTEQRSVTHLHSLRATEASGLGRVGQELRETLPELRVIEVDTPLEDGGQVFGPEWLWRRSLLNSFPYERHFTLDDGTWRRVIGFQRPNADDDFEHVDYASGDGHTVRFGDGEFARIPGPVWLRADYRRGPGAASNVPAGAIATIVDPALEGDPPPVFAAADVLAVDNPQPVQSGVDPESVEQARQLAPEEFRAVQHRALRPADFCEIAEREPWVERAGARFRWTGSWLTGFVTPDPRDSFEMSAAQRASLAGVLDCVRQAGREIFLSDPRYRPLDLEVTICVRPGSLPSEVRNAVRLRLIGDARTPGYFNPERFTFGTPLVRLTIEGIVGAVRGVLAVLMIRVGARGIHPTTELPGTYAVPKDQILRLANDPRFPERGSLKVFIATEAGA
jgi:predicted phage baseplate assembly protein